MRFLRISRPYQKLILIFLVEKALVVALAFAVSLHYNESMFQSKPFEPVSEHSVINFFCHWDGYQFIEVAKNGYITTPYRGGASGIERFAYFPFYPSLISLLGVLIFDYGLSAILISNFFALLAILKIYDLASLYTDQDPLKVAVALSVYPMFLAFGSVAYNDAIFLFWLICSFYNYKLKNYGRSGLYAFLAVLTRSPGVLLIALYPTLLCLDSLNLRSIFQSAIRNKRVILLYVISVLAALALIFTYFYVRSGDFFVYFEAEKVWKVQIAPPWTSILYNLSGIIEFHSEVYLARLLLSIPPIVAAIYWGWKREKELFLFSLLFLLAYSITGGKAAISFPRFCLSVFPMYLAIQKIVDKNKFAQYGYYVIGMLSGLFVLWAFFTWHLF